MTSFSLMAIQGQHEDFLEVITYVREILNRPSDTYKEKGGNKVVPFSPLKRKNPL